jgi:hypothetical protein
VLKKKKMAQPNYREILTNFWKKYNPDNLHNVDRALESYKGKEPEMFQILANKYAISNVEEIFSQFGKPKPPSWVKTLCDKHGFEDELCKSVTKTLEENGIDQDVFYSLTESHCNVLFNTPLKLRMQIWELVKKETGRSSEVEKLREEIVKLKNEIDQLKAELQSKQ